MKKKLIQSIILSLIASINTYSYSYAYDTIGNVINAEKKEFFTYDELNNSFEEDTTIVYDKGNVGDNHYSTVGARYDAVNNMTIANDKTLKIIGNCYSDAGVIYADDGAEVNFYGGNLIIENIFGEAAVHSKGSAGSNPDYMSTVINFYNADTKIIGNSCYGIRLQAGNGDSTVAPAVNSYGNLEIILDRTTNAQQNSTNNVYGIFQQGGKFLSDQDATISIISNENDKYAIGLWNTKSNRTGSTAIANSTFNGKAYFSITGGEYAYGIYGDNNSETSLNQGVTIQIQDAKQNGYGMYFDKGKVQATNGIVDIDINASENGYGIYLKESATSTIDGATISTHGNKSAIGSYAHWYSTAIFNDNVFYDVRGAGDDKEVAALARAGSTIEYKKGLQADSEVILNAVGNVAGDGATIKVNSSNDKNVVVQLKGKIIAGKTAVDRVFSESYDVMVDADSTKNVISANLLNSDSYFTGINEFGNSGSEINLNFANGAKWNMTDSSPVTDLEIADGAVVDMTYSNTDAGSEFRELIAKSISGEGGFINMNIDASANTDNSDRVYIDGTHSGTHYITLNNVDKSGMYDAAGTVLVSVNDEQGEFLAKPDEGTLYWNKYTLDRLDKTDGETVTDGYNTDWILAEVEQTDDPTTSVDTILGANALNYHTWLLESDKMMKRMGDLRHNGEDEKGVWFRVRGSKISRDDSAAFENKYTTYELGYDTLDKETEDYKRYAGAAISYSDGSSSYEHGSGENSGKAISFYSTTMRNKGHYLDFVFKVVDMDNDFSVFDTNSNNITGAMDNQGISLNVEYGRKKDLGNKWYIEPQGQLTLGYLGGDNYRLNNGVAVEQGGISSLVGRIGFNIGRDLDEKTNLYLKANLLHEFLGDYSLDMTDTATGDTLHKDGSFGDTWGEIGIGAAIQTGKNNHIYFDVEKTFGGDFEKDWGWNAGVRWTF